MIRIGKKYVLIFSVLTNKKQRNIWCRKRIFILGNVSSNYDPYSFNIVEKNKSHIHMYFYKTLEYFSRKDLFNASIYMLILYDSVWIRPSVTFVQLYLPSGQTHFNYKEFYSTQKEIVWSVCFQKIWFAFILNIFKERR